MNQAMKRFALEAQLAIIRGIGFLTIGSIEKKRMISMRETLLADGSYASKRCIAQALTANRSCVLSHFRHPIGRVLHARG